MLLTHHDFSELMMLKSANGIHLDKLDLADGSSLTVNDASAVLVDWMVRRGKNQVIIFSDDVDAKDKR